MATNYIKHLKNSIWILNFYLQKFLKFKFLISATPVIRQEGCFLPWYDGWWFLRVRKVMLFREETVICILLFAKYSAFLWLKEHFKYCAINCYQLLCVSHFVWNKDKTRTLEVCLKQFTGLTWMEIQISIPEWQVSI